MSTEHNGQPGLLTANRRDVIRAATGLAAAAVAGGTLVSTTQQANAQGNSKNARLFCEIDDIGQFELLSFSWGMASEGDSGSASGARRMTKADIITQLPTGSASPKLQLACVQAKLFERAIITQTDNRGTPYLTYTFQDVLVSSYQTSADRDGGFIDVMSFSFNTTVRLTVGGEGYEWNFGTNTGGPV